MPLVDDNTARTQQSYPLHGIMCGSGEFQKGRVLHKSIRTTSMAFLDDEMMSSELEYRWAVDQDII